MAIDTTIFREHNVSTTFQRIVRGLSVFNGYKNLTRVSVPDNEIRLKFRDKTLMASTSYTNFKLMTHHSKWEDSEDLLLEDLDFYIPLRPKKSFMVKPKKVYVTKFKPKPFFD